MNDNHIEAVASALALADGYNPNDFGTSVWDAKAYHYREMAVKAMEAMQPYMAARMAEMRVDASQKLLYVVLRLLMDVPVTPEIEESLTDIRQIHVRLGRVREEMERTQNG